MPAASPTPRPPGLLLLLNPLLLPVVVAVYYSGIEGACHHAQFVAAGARAAGVAALGAGANVLFGGWLLWQRRWGLAAACLLLVLLYLGLAFYISLDAGLRKRGC